LAITYFGRDRSVPKERRDDNFELLKHLLKSKRVSVCPKLPRVGTAVGTVRRWDEFISDIVAPGSSVGSVQLGKPLRWADLPFSHLLFVLM
jgi:hypothetical protein